MIKTKETRDSMEFFIMGVGTLAALAIVYIMW